MDVAKLILEFVKVLAWPTVVVIGVVLFRLELSALIASLEHLKLPGGAELDWKRQVREAEQAAERVDATPRAATSPTQPAQAQLSSRLQEHGLLSSPTNYDWEYYSKLAESDPNLALAGLRMEIERMLQNMARVSGVEYDPFRTTPNRFIGLLRSKDVLGPEEYDLLRSVISVANAALHGRDVTEGDAQRTIQSASAFKDSYLAFMDPAISRLGGAGVAISAVPTPASAGQTQIDSWPVANSDTGPATSLGSSQVGIDESSEHQD